MGKNFKLQHILIIFLMVLACATATASKKNTSRTLPKNRWREVRRFNADSVEVSFSDTMFINIRPKGAFSYHNKDAFVYNGNYTLIDKELDFGYAKFRMLSKKPTSMILKDKNGFYHFTIDSTDTLRTIVMPKEEKIDSNITIEQMIGHWTAYRRSAAKPLSNIDHSNQIKSVIITGPSSDGKLGFIFSDLDKSDSPSWFIKRLGKALTLECEGKSTRNIKVLKCQNGELILEDDDIKYYFKQFK